MVYLDAGTAIAQPTTTISLYCCQRLSEDLASTHQQANRDSMPQKLTYIIQGLCLAAFTDPFNIFHAAGIQKN